MLLYGKFSVAQNYGKAGGFAGAVYYQITYEVFYFRAYYSSYFSRSGGFSFALPCDLLGYLASVFKAVAKLFQTFFKTVQLR